jgi:RNA polymerase sigma factor (sigma-70 family)
MPETRRLLIPLGPLTSPQRALADSYAPAIDHLINRYSRNYPWLRDDMRSAAYEALVVCASRWREGESKFFTYARPRIIGAIVDEIRHYRPWGYRRAIGNDPQIESVENVTLADTSLPPIGSSAEQRDDIEPYCRKLSSTHAELIRLIYGELEGCFGAHARAAAAFGVDKSSMSRMHSEAIRALRSVI